MDIRTERILRKVSGPAPATCKISGFICESQKRELEIPGKLNELSMVTQ